MSQSRKNKCQRAGNNTVAQDWFKKNTIRARKRAKLAKLSKRKNRNK